MMKEKDMNNVDVTTSSFESLIKSGCVYVDKTDYLYSIVRKGIGYYFLSRPRRFGKSLTLSTLEAIFKGKKELFKGLYIGGTNYDFKEYSVIHIDFLGLETRSCDMLERSLLTNLSWIASDYGVFIQEKKSLKETFQLLIKELAEKFGSVVILIDEYDKPLSDNINKLDEALKIRDLLRTFFEVIKSSVPYIRFVFITGVTKYSKVSVFSAMNNLNDLSLNRNYATMLGYTQEELEHYFKEGIDEGLAGLGLTREDYLRKVKEWYDGYRFAPMAETVYNPVAIGFLFDQNGVVFNSFWSTTGGSKLLYDLANGSNFNVETDIEKNFLVDKFSAHDIVDLANGNITKDKYNSLLFQSGYLTIADSKLDGRLLSFDFPNKDVSEFFTDVLLPLYVGEENKYKTGNLMALLADGDVESFVEEVKAMFASVPYDTRDRYEHSYEVGFYCMLRAIGANVNAEVPTNKGRIDVSLELGDHIYIFEFKVGKTAEEALSQIKQNGYAEKYNAPRYKGKTLHLVGVSFSESDRNVDQILYETHQIQ